MTARYYRTAVFDRNTEHPGAAAVVNHQLISESGNQQVARGNPRVGFGLTADNVVSVVLGVVNEGAVVRINPVVGHNAVPGRVGAGRQGCMPHRGFGVRMLVMGIGVPGAVFKQITESTLSQAIPVAARQVAAQLIHCDLENQLGSGGICQRWGCQR